MSVRMGPTVPREHANPDDGGYIASSPDVLPREMCPSNDWDLCTERERTIYRGKSAVRSQPALMEFAEILVLRMYQQRGGNITHP